MRLPKSTAGAALAILALALGACGGSDSSSGSSASTPEPTATATPAATETPASGGGGATIAESAPADGSLKFTKDKLTAKAGKVTIAFDNPSSVPHAVEIEGKGVKKKTKVVTGGNADVTVDLKPGTYEFYCPVDGHKQAGMEGTLTVQ